MPSAKIGYVLKRYPRYSETFIVNEILAHEAAGQEIEIFALRPVEESHFQDILGRVRAPVTRVPDRLKNTDAFWTILAQAHAQLPGAWRVLAEMGEAEGRDVAQAVVIALACREKKVAHLHAHFGTVSTTVARIAARLAGITYSFTAHAKDIFFDYDQPVQLDFKLRDATAAITVSEFNVAYLRSQFGPDADRVVRIYNGLDLERFSYTEPRPEATEILAVGRLVEKKGFDVLVDAIATLRDQGLDARCRIIGGGEEDARLTDRIRRAGLQDRVILAGPLPQSAVIEAMRSAAVFACPCVVGEDGNRDGMPTVLLEAMALGTPCIATSVTGIPELVRDGETGLCVPEGDAGALANGLARLLDDAALRARFSRSARALIESEFDVTASAACLREIFRKAASGGMWGTPPLAEAV